LLLHAPPTFPSRCGTFRPLPPRCESSTHTCTMSRHSCSTSYIAAAALPPAPRELAPGAACTPLPGAVGIGRSLVRLLSEVRARQAQCASQGPLVQLRPTHGTYCNANVHHQSLLALLRAMLAGRTRSACACAADGTVGAGSRAACARLRPHRTGRTYEPLDSHMHCTKHLHNRGVATPSLSRGAARREVPRSHALARLGPPSCPRLHHHLLTLCPPAPGQLAALAPAT